MIFCWIKHGINFVNKLTQSKILRPFGLKYLIEQSSNFMRFVLLQVTHLGILYLRLVEELTICPVLLILGQCRHLKVLWQ